MLNLSMMCALSIMFFGVCAMLGYVLSAYQQLQRQHEELKAKYEKSQEQK